MPLAMIAQDDDLYFVPKKKKAQVEKVKDITPVVAPQPKAKSSYEVIDGDTTKLDVIDFTEGKGIYPADTLETEDFALTKNMVRFDDYDVSDNDAFWAGYRAGRDTWMWHSPWYYGRYGWYDPWYYGSWYSYRWYRPYYYSWYDPWFYGWYDPWYGPYYSYYGYYGWPYYRYGYAYYGGGGYRHYYGRTGNAGTIDIKGSTGHRASYRNTVTTNGARMSSLRERASRMGGNRVYTSGNTQRSASGNFSGRRGGNNNSNYNYSSPTRSSNSSYSSGSFGGSRSSSGGSFGGSRSSGGGGGGGSRMGGRR
jgi:hypothetical protein